MCLAHDCLAHQFLNVDTVEASLLAQDTFEVFGTAIVVMESECLPRAAQVDPNRAAQLLLPLLLLGRRLLPLLMIMMLDTARHLLQRGRLHHDHSF